MVDLYTCLGKVPKIVQVLGPCLWLDAKNL